jgi:DNA-directed RNA polymerase subunit RPC12/RpoP
MRVDRYEYWNDRPPEPSPYLRKWVIKIKYGWTPNKRISRMGYDCSAEFFRVYIWEYLNIIAPLLYGTKLHYEGPYKCSECNKYFQFDIGHKLIFFHQNINCPICKQPINLLKILIKDYLNGEA